MSNPKVVFEAVPSRYRVEYRDPGSFDWRASRCYSTLEEACEDAQEWSDNNPDSNYRVVDTRPDTVRVGQRPQLRGD